ncbi:ribosome biogenesis factor YjgA [Methyloterricola oryzae]|uniref:ribosome biogenesis factor YjgA n=1 Tax=Methyloterricola oryzae TaxID=1495050 RepID=UPI0005EAD90C|nr:ribosome biogenesis factor YjgA [Methyloterricola oryzae]
MTVHDQEEEFDDYAERPSKSQIKRECHALEELGEELAALSAEKLSRFDLSPELREAIRQVQTITSHGALKRQRKFVGKLLRETDAEPIRQQLASLSVQSAQAVHALHRVEQWRDRLLAGDDHDVNACMELHPEADRQKLRQLVRDARRERAAEAPPRSARLLFKYLRELMVEQAEDAQEEET